MAFLHGTNRENCAACTGPCVRLVVRLIGDGRAAAVCPRCGRIEGFPWRLAAR